MSSPRDGGEGVFGEVEIALLEEIQPLAEELVGERYRLTAFKPPEHTYEVVTLTGGGADCRAAEALAMLCRFDRRERPIGGDQGRVSRFYRVCLQDDNLLARVEQGFALRALLLYVLTHELIHIVRFERFEVSYRAVGAAREAEEAIVDRLTWEILEPLEDEALRKVRRELAAARVDVFARSE